MKGVTVKTGSHITSSIHLHWLGSVRTGDMMSLIAYYLCKRYYVAVVVCSGLTSLSTIFQPYHDGVWLRQEAQRSLL